MEHLASTNKATATTQTSHHPPDRLVLTHGAARSGRNQPYSPHPSHCLMAIPTQYRKDPTQPWPIHLVQASNGADGAVHCHLHVILKNYIRTRSPPSLVLVPSLSSFLPHTHHTSTTPPHIHISTTPPPHMIITYYNILTSCLPRPYIIPTIHPFLKISCHSHIISIQFNPSHPTSMRSTQGTHAVFHCAVPKVPMPSSITHFKLNQFAVAY